MLCLGSFSLLAHFAIRIFREVNEKVARVTRNSSAKRFDLSLLSNTDFVTLLLFARPRSRFKVWRKRWRCLSIPGGFWHRIF